VLALLARRAPADGVALVGIDGGGGAGKSTLARAVAAAGGAIRVVHLDDFFLTTVGGPESVDVERLRREALDPLLRGEPARFRRFEWWGEHLPDEHVVEPGRVVVVEGVFTLQQALRPLFHVTAWVETDEALRLERGLERDGENARELWEEWQEAERRHAHEVGGVDLVVLG
jgi:uridine kinase